MVEGEATVKVLQAGLLCTVQDGGRVQQREVGFPQGGVLDRRSVSLANCLVGNAPFTAVLEFYQRGPVLRFMVDAMVVVCGQQGVTLDGRRVLPWFQLPVKAGEVLDCGVVTGVNWGYVVVEGGFSLPPFFGCVSTHPHLGIGGYRGRALQQGDVLPCSSAGRVGQYVTSKGMGVSLRPEGLVVPAPYEIRLVKGRQWEWFSEAARDALLTQCYVISSQSNRVGYRLEGEALGRCAEFRGRELVSEGACPGTVQVANDGLPIVLMADAQSVGGYPKIAHVIRADLSTLAQVPIGQALRFKLVSYEEALSALEAEERERLRFAQWV